MQFGGGVLHARDFSDSLLAFEMAERCGARLHGKHVHLSEGVSEFQDPGNPGRLFHADRVFEAWAEREGELGVVEGVALEVQRRHDELKLVSWVVYRAGIRSRHRCRGWTLVIAPSSELRARARALFEDEPELCPLILEPDLIPPILNVFQARRRPDLAVLAAVMHAETPHGVASARAAALAVRKLPRWQRQCYLPLLEACLTEEQMSELVEQVPKEVAEEFSEFDRRTRWFTRAHREGLEEGRQQGRQEGRQVACQALAAKLKRTLSERGVRLSAGQRARVDACGDLEQLSTWLLRAGGATSADEVFAVE